ncbi:MAG: guanylate kinase [Proteobacteria bacterium]|nr:guanylate kinase [Cystobacterineae bacterium]MCL2314699.1 guanylate kinase [Pseudomonadota bacterium]
MEAKARGEEKKMATFPGGLLLVLSAPSGAGKTTLARALVAQTEGARFSVSTTTRALRGREKEGEDYFFTEEGAFMEKAGAGFFIEWAKVHGNCYGSPRSEVTHARAQSSLVVFDIDTQGGRRLREKEADCVLVFVMPPSFEELERRLRSRHTDDARSIARRLEAARAEIGQGLEFYDYIIVNDEVSKALERLKSILIAEGCRRSRLAQAEKLPSMGND